MADQILSQVEVDALLKGLTNGDIKTESKKDEDTEGVRPYDLTSPKKTVRARMPTLEMIYGKFCRNARTSLLNFLKKTVDVAFEDLKTMKYEEFIKNLVLPSSLNIFQMQPLRGQGLLAIDPNLVFLIVDNYFGGDGRFHTRIEGREFTYVEQTVIKRVVDILLKEMQTVWKPIHHVEFKLQRTEMNPQFANIVASTDIMVVATFRMEIEASHNKFFLAIPYMSIEPIKEKLYGGFRDESAGIDTRWKEVLKEQIGNVPLTVTSEIGMAQIKVSELINLKVGDVILLDKKSKEPIEVKIEGIPKLLAKPGFIDNNYALEILSLK